MYNQKGMVLTIGLSGKLGSGKDTLGEAMLSTAEQNGFSVHRRAYSDALKEEAADFLTRHSPFEIVQFIRQFAKDKDQGTRIINQLLSYKNGLRTSLRDYRGIPFPLIVEAMNDRDRKEQYREWMIFWGTEYRRKNFGWDYWLGRVESYIVEKRATSNNLLFYIPDVRFLNEVQFTQENLGGYMIRIERPDLVSSITHQSETELDGYKFFNMTVLNNRSLEDFKRHGPLAFLQALAWKAGAASVSQAS